VAVKPTIAIVAASADEVDFAYNALFDELRWSISDRADEFVSRDTSESHVGLKNL